jgi:hypothetical protein
MGRKSNAPVQSPADGAPTKVLQDIRKYGVSAIGKTDYKRFLASGKVTPLQGVKAKCYDCMGFYQDGKVDCEQVSCPLYPFMPYRKSDQQ